MDALFNASLLVQYGVPANPEISGTIGRAPVAIRHRSKATSCELPFGVRTLRH